MLILHGGCEDVDEPRTKPRLEPRRVEADLEQFEDLGTGAEIFGHSATELYRIDPETKRVRKVGPFTGGCQRVIDIALDGKSRLYATTADALYSVDKRTAACTLVARGDFPNSLSFLPRGTLRHDREALVGYREATFVEIDPSTGEVAAIGSLSNKNLVSSGDVVSVVGGKTFLTVLGPGCLTDCLVEVDPKTGALRKNFGPLYVHRVYGIAFWAGRVYGFAEAGEMLQISFEAGRADVTLLGKRSDAEFWGAGSATTAPVDASYERRNEPLVGTAF